MRLLTVGTARAMLLATGGAAALMGMRAASEIQDAGRADCPVTAGWSALRASLPASRISNSVSVRDGRILWNGLPIDERTLRDYVGLIAQMRPRPATILYAQGVDCAEQRRIAEMIAAAAQCTPDDCLISPAEPPPRMVAPAPPAPPPPPPPISGTRLRPLTSPQAWVTNDDYPAAALRARQSGTVGFVLYVGTDGVPTGCDITGSSGHAVLDEATCRLMTERARFHPARDASNRPVAGMFHSRFRWELPATPDPAPTISPAQSWSVVVRVRLGPDAVIGCETEKSGEVPTDLNIDCADTRMISDPAVRRMGATAERPVGILMRVEHVADGATDAPPDEASYQTVLDAVATFDVDAGGAVGGCEMRINGQRIDRERCDPPFPYRGDGRAHATSIRMAVATDGDAATLREILSEGGIPNLTSPPQ